MFNTSLIDIFLRRLVFLFKINVHKMSRGKYVSDYEFKHFGSLDLISKNHELRR